MKIEKVNIHTLISPDYNPRQITDEAMESLKTSLDEFGYIDPLIVNRVNNHVVGGNQRLHALKELGYDEVDVIYINEPDINREKAINIRLNNNSGDWDIGKLDNIFQDLELEGFDLSLTGFETDKLQPFNVESEPNNMPTSEIIAPDLNTGLKPERGINRTDPDYKEPEHEIKEDSYKDENIKVHVAKGDLFKLGNHYLFCGDATNADDVEILLNADERESFD